MVSPLFVAAADLHFDEFGVWKHRGIVVDAAHALAQVVDYCLEHAAAPLWLLGDLMNRSTPRQTAVKEILDQFDRLQHGGVPTRYVLGDHDGRQDWPNLHPWPKHMDGLCEPVGPFLSYGLDYAARGKLQALLRDIPQEAQILFTHQKWEEFVSRSGQAKLTDVPPHVRYVVTGDFHDQVWGEFGTGQHVWSPGSTHATSVADDKPRYFLVGWEQDGALVCEFIPLVSRPIIRVRAEDSAALAFIVGPGIDGELEQIAKKRLPELISKPIVDVEYATNIPHAYEQIMRMADRCHVFPRPRSPRRWAYGAQAQSRQPALSIEEAVARLAYPGTPGHDWTLRLLRASDRQVEWRAIVEEHRSPSCS
jgi:hypothetical protein